MAEATCRRELELEIPAEEVTKRSRVSRRSSRASANVPGFRRGKAPISLIRRKFADDIKGEVAAIACAGAGGKKPWRTEAHSSFAARKWIAGFQRGPAAEVPRGLRSACRNSNWGNYKGLEFEMPTMDITDEDVANALEEMRERAASLAPVEGRAIQDGDFH